MLSLLLALVVIGLLAYFALRSHSAAPIASGTDNPAATGELLHNLISSLIKHRRHRRGLQDRL